MAACWTSLVLISWRNYGYCNYGYCNYGYCNYGYCNYGYCNYGCCIIVENLDSHLQMQLVCSEIFIQSCIDTQHPKIIIGTYRKCIYIIYMCV